MRKLLICVAALVWLISETAGVQGQEKVKPPPTRIPAKEDTLQARKRPVKKKPAPGLEIPDVLIYGRDTMKRVVGRKLTPPGDSARVVSPPVSFERQPAERLVGEKTGLQVSTPVPRRTWVRLLGGRFTTLTGQLVRWDQLGSVGYNFEARVGRSSGQFSNSEYARADLSGSLGFALGKRLRGDVQGIFRLSDYGLHGSVAPGRDRQLSSGYLRSRWLWTSSAGSEIELSAEGGVLRLEPEPPDLLARFGSSTDRWFRLKGRVAWGPEERRLSLAGDLMADHFDSGPLPDHDVRLGSVWAAASVALSPQSTLSVTLGLQRRNIEGDRLTFFAPRAKIMVQATPRFGLHASAGRELRYEPFPRLLAENPYVTLAPSLRPEEAQSYLEVGAEYRISENVALVGLLRNEQMDDYGFWQREDSTGLFSYGRLDNVGLTSFAAGLRLSVPSRLAADARLVVLDDHRGSPGSTVPFDLPYRERYQVPVQVTYRPSDRVKLSTSSTWVSSRRIRLSSRESLSAYWLLDAEVEVEVAPNVAILLQGKNLTDRRYSLWQGYPETGVVVMGGVVARW